MKDIILNSDQKSIIHIFLQNSLILIFFRIPSMDTQLRPSRPTVSKTIASRISSTQGRSSLINDIRSGKHSNKIEVNHQKPSASHKHYLISDSDYNSMVFQWRKRETAPIVTVSEVSRNIEFSKLHMGQSTRCTVQIQKISRRLNQMDNFSKQQVLFIIKSLLNGHQAIFKKLGATSISLDKAGINKKGQIKMWINKEFDRNDVSGQILTKQEQIVERLIDLIEILGGKNLACLKNYILTSFQKQKSKNIKSQSIYTFSSLKAMLRSYIQCLRIKLPSELRSKQIKPAQLKIHSKRDKSIEFSLMSNSVRNRAQSYRRNLCSSHFNRKNVNSIHQSINKNHLTTQSQAESMINSRKEEQLISELIPQSNKSNLNNLVEIRKRRKPSITINGNTINTLSAKNSLIFKSTSGNLLNSDPLFLSKQCSIKANSMEKNANCLKEQDYINQQLTPRHEKNKANQMFLSKIGIPSLPEVQYEEQSSQSVISSHRKIRVQRQKEEEITDSKNMITQFNMNKSRASKRQSGISSTNYSTTTQHISFSKKCKGSNITILVDEKEQKQKQKNQFRSASQKGRYNAIGVGGSEYKKQITSQDAWKGPKNISNSSCENILTIHRIMLDNIVSNKKSQDQNQSSNQKQLQGLEDLKQNNQFDQNKRQNNGSIQCIFQSIKENIPEVNKQQTIKQVKENNLNVINSTSLNQLDSAELKTPLWSQKPLNFVTELITENELESYQNTQRRSQSPSKGSQSKRSSVEQHVLELLKLNKKLVISTYLETESEKKVKSPGTPPKSRQERFRQLSEGLSQLMTANLNSQKVITKNCWTKKLETLLGLGQLEMKKSINYGPELKNQFQSSIKLSKLDLCGRDIGESMIPE